MADAPSLYVEGVWPRKFAGTAFKHHTVVPQVAVKAKKQKAARTAWRKTSKAVDKRDAVDEAPVCFITGKRLSTETMDPWLFRDRAHLEPRSKSKARKFEVENVISVSRGVHKLIDGGALLLLDKKGRPATSRKAIDHVAWNRRLIAKKDEPCKVRNGLPIVELEQVSK
jgi:hypothetical protein